VIAIIQRFVCRLRAVFSKPSLDADFSAELAQHLEAATADNIRAGLTPDEARRKAHIALGGVEQIRELHREARGLPSLENLARDIRFGLRMLRKSPGFTVVAIATLALGIGMNTAMFSMLNGLLLRPLSFSQVGQLFRLDRNSPEQPQADHTADNFLDIRAASADVAELAGLHTWASSLNAADGSAEIVGVARVTANFFDVLQVAPLYGRRFRPEEELLRQNNVIALSHEYWLMRFGGRKDVIGTVVRLDKQSVEIVAVMPSAICGAGVACRSLAACARASGSRRPRRISTPSRRISPGGFPMVIVMRCWGCDRCSPPCCAAPTARSPSC